MESGSTAESEGIVSNPIVQIRGASRISRCLMSTVFVSVVLILSTSCASWIWHRDGRQQTLENPWLCRVKRSHSDFYKIIILLRDRSIMLGKKTQEGEKRSYLERSTFHQHISGQERRSQTQNPPNGQSFSVPLMARGDEITHSEDTVSTVMHVMVHVHRHRVWEWELILLESLTQQGDYANFPTEYCWCKIMQIMCKMHEKRT